MRQDVRFVLAREVALDKPLPRPSAPSEANPILGNGMKLRTATIRIFLRPFADAALDFDCHLLEPMASIVLRRKSPQAIW